MKKPLLALSLAFPILGLFALMSYKQKTVFTGQNFILPIQGYDPRDLIAGHYLRFQYKLEIPDICTGKDQGASAVVCLNTMMEDMPSSACPSPLKGRCNFGRFTTGEERFYIPEDMGKDLEAKIREGRATVSISNDRGTVVIRKLLIDGRPYDETR